jgi:hypothetical protein
VLKISEVFGNDCQLDFGCCQTCKGQSGVWFMEFESEVWGRGVGLCPARKAGMGGGGAGGEKGEGSREKQGGENKHCWSPRTVEKVHN